MSRATNKKEQMVNDQREAVMDKYKRRETRIQVWRHAGEEGIVPHLKGSTPWGPSKIIILSCGLWLRDGEYLVEESGESRVYSAEDFERVFEGASEARALVGAS